MARTSNKDRDANETVMGTFRIKSGMWEQFKQLATDNDATATDLIISFIENCLKSQSIPPSIQDTDKSPPSNLDSIYKYIDTKLDKLDIQSRQNVVVSPQPNLDDICTYIDSKLDKDIDGTVKKAISGSLEDGEVGEAIAKIQQKFSDENNELQRQIYALEESLEELKAAIPQSPVTSPQSTVPNHQLPVTSEEVINFLGIADILDGDPYWEDKLIESGINQKIVDNVRYLSEKLNIKVSPKGYAIARFNLILDALGYVNKKQGQHTKPNSKKQDKYIAVQVAR